MHLPAFTHGTRPPYRRVANGRSQLKYLLGTPDQRQLMKEVAHGRANNRNLVFARFRFHLRQHFVARGKKRVEVIVDSGLGDVTVMPPARGFRLSCHSLLRIAQSIDASRQKRFRLQPAEKELRLASSQRLPLRERASAVGRECQSVLGTFRSAWESRFSPAAGCTRKPPRAGTLCSDRRSEAARSRVRIGHG